MPTLPDRVGRRHRLLSAAALAAGLLLTALSPEPTRGQDAPTFTRTDTLRGTLGPARAWWDVTFYDLHVRVQPGDSSLAGRNAITYRAVAGGREMQIDLQPPMELDSVVLAGEALSIRHDGNAHFVTLPRTQRPGEVHTVTAHFHGRPTVAANPPWDGGYTWTTDDSGRTWIATSNQSLGASVWWPNKDHMAEEPDSQRIAVTVPDPLVDVSNGRLRSTRPNGDGTATYEWFVASPVNNYSVSVNAGHYAHWTEEMEGEAGTLTLDFWPLEEDLEDARRQWAQVRPTLACFEEWFGPYPWYEDGYKLVQVPYLGMEHQSAVTYGNRFMNGYLGRDLSGTGWGLEWDFIIVHETAHEWWGNNLTVADGADLWVHEGFANYAENIYTECLTGSARAGAEYVIGTRAGIRNDRPVIGHYGVNDEGSGDRYSKGGNLLHTIRQLVDDDHRWKAVLRGLNRDFRHQTVTSAQVEAYITRHSGVELERVFEQYLRTTRIPTLEYERSDGLLSFRWTNVVEGFRMPVRVTLEPGRYVWIRPTERWRTLPTTLPPAARFRVDEDFYVRTRDVGTGDAGS